MQRQTKYYYTEFYTCILFHINSNIQFQSLEFHKKSNSLHLNTITLHRKTSVKK